MRNYRTMPKREYAALRNSLLQDFRLSLGAHGLLAYLLSLKDHEQVDIKGLAAKFPDSQAKIAGFLHELVCWGYMIRRRVRDPETREIRTVIEIYDIPQTAPDEDMAVVTGEFSQVGPRLESPSFEAPRPYPSGKTGIKEPPLPPQPELPFEEPGGREEDLSSIGQEDHAHGAALLGRLGRQEPRLALGVLEMSPLLPILAEWRSRGASDMEIRQTLTDGLPPRVYSPKKFIADRLVRKMPPRRVIPVIPVRTECDTCGRPIAAGACGHCIGQTIPRPYVNAEATARGMAKVRAELRRR